MELSKEKTRILPFGRKCDTRETFDFLGFTHYNSKTRKGYYTLGHKISRKKKKQFKSNLKKWVKENRNTQDIRNPAYQYIMYGTTSRKRTHKIDKF